MPNMPTCTPCGPLRAQATRLATLRIGSEAFTLSAFAAPASGAMQVKSSSGS